jgi:hypothetical protein
MKAICSLTTGFLLLAAVLARADEAPPVPYHGAPLIPYAKSVGEHRFRSPRNFDGTMEYYQKAVLGKWKVALEKIVNNAEIRAVHIKNLESGPWEGLNIYENKGAAYIFVVLSDEELKKLAREKAEKAQKSGREDGQRK